MRINKILITLISACFAFGSLYAQNLNRAKIDTLFNVLAANHKAMGSVTLSRNGVVIYQRAIGSSFITDGFYKPANIKTRYRIGSVSKMFTAAIIFQLVDRGLLNLNTTLDKYFPEIPNAKFITISHLLNHRSGLHNFTNDADYLTWMDKPRSRQEIMAVISRNQPDFPSGQKAAYSNTNYLLLGWIAEDIHQQPFATILYERICQKAGLMNTYIGGQTDTSLNESYSYKFIRNWQPEPVTDLSIPGGAGAIVSTPADLCVFIDALFNDRLVSDSSLQKMKTMTEGFGMGMFTYPFYNKKGFGHTGGIDGFASMLTYFPEDSLAVAYCSNGQVYAMNDILIGVLSAYYNKPYSIPQFSNVTYKPEDLNKYIGLYSSAQMPMKITITKDSVTLIAQASGQSAFRLEATEADKFRNEPAGLRMEFNPDRKEMILRQGGGVFLFTREKQ
jgi:D-alanyl-D-alanine carboxypeptidase